MKDRIEDLLELVPFNRYFEPVLDKWPSGWKGVLADVALGIAWGLLLLAITLASRSGDVPFVYGQF